MRARDVLAHVTEACMTGAQIRERMGFVDARELHAALNYLYRTGFVTRERGTACAKGTWLYTRVRQDEPRRGRTCVHGAGTPRYANGKCVTCDEVYRRAHAHEKRLIAAVWSVEHSERRRELGRERQRRIQADPIRRAKQLAYKRAWAAKRKPTGEGV